MTDDTQTTPAALTETLRTLWRQLKAESGMGDDFRTMVEHRLARSIHGNPFVAVTDATPEQWCDAAEALCDDLETGGQERDDWCGPRVYPWI